MKRVIHIVAVVACLHSMQAEPTRRQFTHVPMAELMDNQTPGVDADAIAGMRKVIYTVMTLMHGEKRGGTVKKSYTYKDSMVDLNELVAIFDDLEKNAVPHDHPDYQAAVRTLNDMIEKFIVTTEPLLEGNTRLIQKMMFAIIHKWAHLTGRHNSGLLNWGKDDEKTLLRKLTAQQFRQFCKDLNYFLIDLMASCPKGRDAYKKKYLKEAEQSLAFDKMFNQN